MGRGVQKLVDWVWVTSALRKALTAGSTPFQQRRRPEGSDGTETEWSRKQKCREQVTLPVIRTDQGRMAHRFQENRKKFCGEDNHQ